MATLEFIFKHTWGNPVLLCSFYLLTSLKALLRWVYIREICIKTNVKFLFDLQIIFYLCQLRRVYIREISIKTNVKFLFELQKMFYICQQQSRWCHLLSIIKTKLSELERWQFSFNTAIILTNSVYITSSLH